MTILDAVVLLTYLSGMLAIGFWFSGKSSQPEGFMAADRSLPGWVVGLSIFGTYVSSISFIANPGKSYQANWNPFVFSLSIPLAALIAVNFFIPFYRQQGEISAYQHLEARFGPWARVYAVTCYLLTQIGRVGTILYLVAVVLFPLFDRQIPIHWIIIGTGTLVTAYTLLGGIEAVIWTDAVQSLVLSAGIIVSIVTLLLGLPEGPMQVFEVAQANRKFSLGSLDFSLVQETFWLTLLYGLFINLQNFGIDQSYVQRYATARSEGDAQRSIWLGALLYLPISAMLFFIGTALYVFYQVGPAQLPDGIRADDVYPWFIVQQLPPGITGLLTAAILAAAMSSVDSSLNCSATLIYCDLYKRFFHSAANDQQAMRVLYAATLLFGVIGTAAGCAMIGSKSVLDAWWAIAGIFSGGMLGLFLLGYLNRRANSQSALWGVCVGVLIILWTTLARRSFWKPVLGESATESWAMQLSWLECPLHSSWTIILSTSAIILVGSLHAAFSNGSRTPQRSL